MTKSIAAPTQAAEAKRATAKPNRIGKLPFDEFLERSQTVKGEYSVW
jgi:hypothetical protein